MKKYILTVSILVVISIVSVFTVFKSQQDKINDLKSQMSKIPAQQQTKTENNNITEPKTYESTKGVKVMIYKPYENDVISSPLVVFGEVPGNWSFEASFSIHLEDNNGNRLASGIAQLQDNWMTEKRVPFVAKLEFSSTYKGIGKIILEKDNPSGMPENDDSVIIPISLN